MTAVLGFSKFAWARPVILGLVPLLLLICGVRSLPPESEGERVGQRQVYAVPKFRTVVILLDSLGTPMAFDPSLMPFVSSLSSTSLFGEAAACPGKATFPCVKSIFEGRTATTGTTLQDFSAVASHRTTWPSSLAALGHRLVLTSDHTINRLYPDAFVDAMNYETLHVPLLERDGYAYERARQWLGDPSIDVLLLHIIGTDVVAHKHPVGGPEYRQKYLEADNFVREVAGRLTPQDYLYVIGDHGHNQLGGHTEDAAYIAHGPLFPQGRHENLGAADMLFLLSAPYGLTLPEEYEGEIRTDLTLLPEELRRKLLTEQARLWRIGSEGLSNSALETGLNQHVIRSRARGERMHGTEMLWRLGPWLFAVALFLLGELKRRNPERSNVISSNPAVTALFVVGVLIGLAGIPSAAWLVVVAGLWRCMDLLGVKGTLGALIVLSLIGTLVFWVLPSGLRWFFLRRNQPLAYAIFFPVAAAAGLAFTWIRGAASPRQHFVRVLWTIGVAIWLLAYFGPSTAALTGRGVKVVLAILAPLAIVSAGGFRTLLAFPTLCLFGLIPFMDFHTDSFNIHYRFLDRLAEIPRIINLALGAMLAAILVHVLRVWGTREGRLRSRRAWICALALALGWLLTVTGFFQFSAERVIGCLLGSLWLIGCLELFRRANLSPSWSALTGGILLFATFHFVLDGFALSHVDFRFAADKIFPFQEEWLRAPQLILWAVVKYLFVLLPSLLVLFLALGKEAAREEGFERRVARLFARRDGEEIEDISVDDEER